MNAHDRKRAARFAQAGIDATDIATADTSYISPDGGSCSLCDHELKHLFRLTFPAKVVTFEPVGSQCITDWMKALPPSPERDAALGRVKEAEKEMRRLQAEAKDRETLLERLGDDHGGLMRRYFALPEAAKTDTLKDIGSRVCRYGAFATPKQAGYFAKCLREAEGSAGPAPQAPATTGLPADPIERTAVLMEKDADNDGAQLMRRYGRLTEDQRKSDETLLDIGTRVSRYGTFISDSQRRLFARRLSDIERAAGTRPAKIAEAQREVGEVPNDADRWTDMGGPDDYPF